MKYDMELNSDGNNNGSYTGSNDSSGAGIRSDMEAEQAQGW